MSLVFNESALHHLLEAPNGPYGDKLRRVAETVTENYNSAIQGVWENQPSSIIPVADFDISVGEFGLQATVGIVDPGVFRSDGKKTISQVIDEKFGLTEKWKFQPKIMANWDAEL